jgi:hypothetical protein
VLRGGVRAGDDAHDRRELKEKRRALSVANKNLQSNKKENEAE